MKQFKIILLGIIVALASVTSVKGQKTQYSQVNTTFDELGSGETWTGTGENVTGHVAVITKCYADKDGTLYMEFSPDNTNWYPLPAFEVDSGKTEFHRITITSPYYRARYVNGASAQGTFWLTTMYGDYGDLNSGINFTLSEDSDAITAKTIGEEILILEEKFSGYRIKSKFGKNSDVDAAEDIWNGGGDYTGFPTSAAEQFQVLSSAAVDSAGGTGARTVRVYYLNDSYEMFDANGDELYFDVTMDGTTAVDAGVTGMRVYRVKVLTSGSGMTNAGSITVRWKTTTSVIFAVVPVGSGQSQLTNFTIPAGWEGHLKRYSAEMDDNTSNSANMAIKTRDFGSNTWRLVRPFVISTTKSKNQTLYGSFDFPEKSDLVFRCTSITNANGIITVDYALLLSKH